MKFQDLLTAGMTHPEEQQRLATRHFPDAVRAHGMRLWKPGQPYAEIGERYLVGVAASYSLHDLQLLDELDGRRRNGQLASVSLDIFDMAALETMHEFEAYIPGLAPVSQTPILGIWVDGILRERLQGLNARQRLLSLG